MCLNYKKAILAGVIAYAVIFLVLSAMMFTPLWGTETQNYINMLVAVAVTYLVAYYFYFKKKPKDALKEGLALGVAMTVVSIIIEIPVMVYGFAAVQGVPNWAWLADWHLIVGYVFGIVACVIAATIKKK